MAALRQALDDLASAAFHVLDDSIRLTYRATPAAVTAYGHTAIQSAILRVAAHDTRQSRHVNVDVVHLAAGQDPLVVIRFLPADTVWTMLGSQYRGTLGLPWPPATHDAP